VEPADDGRGSIGSDGRTSGVFSGGEGAVAAAPSADGGQSAVLTAMRRSLRIGGGKVAEDDSDDDDSEEGPGAVKALGLPKVTDEDLAAAYEISRSSAQRKLTTKLQLDTRGVVGVTVANGEGSSGGEEVLVICALIDILQQYGTRKRLEHSFKSIKYRSERAGISVTDPGRYAERFTQFILSKFCEATPEMGLQLGRASGRVSDKVAEGPEGSESQANGACSHAGDVRSAEPDDGELETQEQKP